jgi:hypothetical protein
LVNQFAQYFQLSLRNESALENETEQELEYYAGYSSTPTPARSDLHSKGSLTVTNPTPGKWFVAVVNPTNKYIDRIADYVEKDCNIDGPYGPECNSEVETLLTDDKALIYQLPIGTYKIFKYVVPSNVDIIISVAPFPNPLGKSLVPKFAVRKGNIPQPGQDNLNLKLTRCSTIPCLVSQVHIFGTASTNDTYFVYVENNSPPTELISEFVIWTGAICPQNCSGVGSCINDLSNLRGTCRCSADLPLQSTFYCALVASDSITIEYIVLIVVLCICVVIALISVIIWANVKRRKIQYEKV